MNIYLVGNYSKSESAFNPIIMPEVTDAEILSCIAHSYYDYSMIYGYSDLSYEYLNFSFGFEYRISRKTLLFIQGDYYDLNGYQGYVYGNESGSYYLIRTGFRTGNLLF